MKKSGSVLWLFTSIVFAIGCTILTLSNIVLHPGSTIIGFGGDSGKNYLSYLYHAIYDKGVWYNGMNYPYGENIIYVDGQPILSTFLNTFLKVSASQALTIMNLLISVSFALSIIFTYKILIRFSVKPFIAILFSGLIIMLDPQIFRVQAHFGLSYVCCLPMLFYWTISFHDTRRWLPLLYIFILGVIISFMHLYMGAMIFIWLGFYMLGYLLLVKDSFRQKVRQMLPVLIVVFSLFLLIKICILLTDPLKDRPVIPFNAPDYNTHIKDVFSSPFSPIWRHIRDNFGFNHISEAGEGFAYLGVITIVCFSISVLLGFIKKRQKKANESFMLSEDKFSPVWLFIAFGALVLAINPLFSVKSLPSFLQFSKQFRSAGRFSWIFYYILSIYTVLAIHSWYLKCLARKRVVLGYTILLVSLLTWAEEAKGYVQTLRNSVEGGNHIAEHFFYELKWANYLADNHHVATDFQAMILLPFFITGSDKLYVGGDPSWPLMLGGQASIQLHLPIVDAMMARSSWSVAEKQVKTVAGPYADKPMLRDLKSNKPFLLLQFEGGDITPDEKYLFLASDYIGDYSRCHVYACYPERIVANDKKYADSITAILPYMHNMDTCLVNKGEWYVNHFDDDASVPHLFGTGAVLPIPEDQKIIATIPIKPLVNDQLYEFSCWFLLTDKDWRSPEVIIQERDSTGKMISGFSANTKISVDNSSLWFLNSFYFPVSLQCRTITLNMLNVPNPSYIAMDEMMLRPADAIIISKAKDGKVLVNNHFLNNNQK